MSDGMPAWAEAMERRLTAAAEATERRLTERINDQHERVLNRLTQVEGELRDLRTDQDTLRRLVASLQRLSPTYAACCWAACFGTFGCTTSPASSSTSP
jgi:hypothetical protein